MELKRHNPEFLLIDDSRDYLRLMSSTLTRLYPGARIRSVADVRAAIESVFDHEPDLIFLDLHLPDGSGCDLLSVLPRADRRFPIVVATLDRDEELFKRSMRAGADDYLVKPIDELLLQSKVDTLLKKRFRSPFAFLGTGQPLAPLTLNIAVRLRHFCEDKIVFDSPVSLRIQTQFRVRVYETDLDVCVLSCDAAATDNKRFTVTAALPEPSSPEAATRIRRLILDLSRK